MRKPPRVLILWGVPGAGKSTFADHLVTHHRYTHIDSDAQGAGGSRAARAWRVVLNNQGKPEMLALVKEFVKVAWYDPQPVVLEYGMFASEAGINLLGAMCQAGAQAWWFDGDRAAALVAWQRKNPTVPTHVWNNVVGLIDANYPALTAFFGNHMVRTIEAGPFHVPPKDTYKAMFDKDR